MTNYIVAAPDGSKHIIAGPDAPPQSAQSPGDAAFAAGREAGQNSSGVIAGVDQAARQYLPLGLGTDVGAAARYVGQRLTGVANPDTFATDLAYSGGQSQGEAEGHPVAATVGGLTGGVGQAIAATPLLKAAMPFKAALATKAAAQGGTKVVNAAKILTQGALGGAEYGAAQGGVQGAINNGNGPSAEGAVTGAATGGATGAVEGAAGTVVASGAVATGSAITQRLGSAEQQSIAALAKIFHISPTDLQTVRNQFQSDAGRPAALGELTDLFNRGEMHAMVGKNPLLGGTVANAANDSAAFLPARLTAAAARTVGPGEDAADLVKARAANADAAMKPIRQTMIPLAPEDVEFLRGEVLPASGLTQSGRKLVHSDLDHGGLTLGNLDTLRQSLNQRAQANPGEGFAELAGGLRQIGQENSDEYAKMLSDYTTDSQYINGHAHGLTGKTIGQTSDPGLIADLSTPAGKYGYQSGVAARLSAAAAKSPNSAASTAAELAQQGPLSNNLANTFSPLVVNNLRDVAGAESRGLESLQGIAPSMPKAPAGPNTGQAALALVSHSLPMKAFHAIKAHVGAGMSDDVARITAKYLTDPSMAQQGLNLMARHGVSQEATRQLLQTAGVAGSIAGNQVANQGQ